MGGAYQEYRATAQYVDPAGTTIQFETGLTAGDPSSTAALNAVPALRAEAATVGTTLHATASGVGGEAPAFYDVSQISNSDLAHVIPIAIVVIGVLLALVMRSLVAPIYLILSVALSYFAALGLAVIVFIWLGNSGGITFILPFLLFIFLLALGEDYNILVMTRIREEAHHMPLREAVDQGHRGHWDHGDLGLAWSWRGRSRCSRSSAAAARVARRSAMSASAWRSASSWTRSWSAPCWFPAPWCCSAGGTGGRRRWRSTRQRPTR